MRRTRTYYKLFAVIGACLLPLAAQAQELSASFTEEIWTGEEVPEGQQCQRFDGEDPRSPEIKLENLPREADSVVLEFSDRDVPRMDEGGHGKVGYTLPGDSGEVTVPSVPGHTEDLPENFFVVAAHKAPNWDKAGAYLPPCSGGRGNNYFVDIKAVKTDDDQAVSEVLAETSIKMGTY